MAAALLERSIKQVKLEDRLFVADSPQRHLRQLSSRIKIPQQLGHGAQLRSNIQKIAERNVRDWNTALCQRQIGCCGLQIHRPKGLDRYDAVRNRRETGWKVNPPAPRVFAPNGLSWTTQCASELTHAILCGLQDP